jgi:hypothetical protein
MRSLSSRRRSRQEMDVEMEEVSSTFDIIAK